jgi:hypothetical protein
LVVAKYFVLQIGSADPTAWGTNTIVETLDIPAPTK